MMGIAPENGSRVFFLHALTIGAAVFLSYLPVFHAEYITLDDDVHYVQNPRTYQLNLDQVKKMFREPLEGNYIVLPEISFAVERALFGLNSRVSHAINLTLFLWTCWLAWVLARRLGLSEAGALWSALLFAVHPAHVSSVAWVSERKDVVFGFFYVAALACYAGINNSRFPIQLAKVTGLGVLALLSKAMAVSLPVALLLIDRLRGRGIDRRAVLEKTPLIVIAAGIAVLTVRAHPEIHYDATLTILQKSALLVWEIGYYLRVGLLPFDLHLTESMPADIGWDYPPAVFSLFAICAVAVGFRLCKQKQPAARSNGQGRPVPEASDSGNPRMGFPSVRGGGGSAASVGAWARWGIAFFFCTVAFALRPVPVGSEVVAERYLYLPLLGFCLLFGRVFSGLRPSWRQTDARARMAGIAVLAFLTVLGVQTYSYASAWRNSFTFWPYILSRNNRFYPGHNNYGLDLVRSGRVREGMWHLHEAVRINPGYDEAHMNLAIQLAVRKQYEHAVEHVEIALSLRPGLPRFLLNTGHIFFEMGKYHQAIDYYARVQSAAPNDVDSLIGLANSYYKSGDWDRAVQYFQRVLAADPENPLARRNLEIVRSASAKAKK